MTDKKPVCCNGDGRPVQPPSMVLCKECLDGIGEKLDVLGAKLEPTPRQEIEALASAAERRVMLGARGVQKNEEANRDVVRLASGLRVALECLDAIDETGNQQAEWRHTDEGRHRIAKALRGE